MRRLIELWFKKFIQNWNSHRAYSAKAEGTRMSTDCNLIFFKGLGTRHYIMRSYFE
jgi:hypothetical protein